MLEQFLQTVSKFPERQVPAGQVVLRQGERRNQLWVLTRGAVEIIKNDVPICTVNERGAIFGELSVLLRVYQLATVRTTEPSTFHLVENADEFLAGDATASVVLARMLGKRLALLDASFSRLKRDYEKLRAEESAHAQRPSTGTQLVSRFIADAERKLEGPASLDRD